MKKILSIFMTLTVVFLLAGFTGFAQDASFYVVTTWKMKIPEGGSNAELDSLMKVFHEKVVLKNEKVVSVKCLRHYWGSDMRDWVFINEYASWNDIEAAGDRQNQLVEEGWTDEKERQKFFSVFWKYVETHSDEIYQDKPFLEK